MDIYTVIQWPDIQDYLDKDGFKENTCLINDEYFLDKYGSSAYFVNIKWKNNVDKLIYN